MIIFNLNLLKEKEKVDSMDDLIKKFEEIVAEESNLIRCGYTIALKYHQEIK